ncbi:uncharacterized protein K452DRAFT_285838 [Aplosporella prunicola CBS 121167]|uniref:Uncharacterized protein n=1 Tax=Aplosporella prunicola CBS 121167 TaxID=1176127 RepID=A0A6A6BI26_9PEZI|nr:uncharacterized protein K452DRAFT_285838 [Aplosporella prunicola CBS 121167]KAF2143799.1 hypothetical protein K452DRAFT_285838 [Aplosporella prunicola CBS 121167]
MSSDAHTGGNLSDMAVKGTTVPGDAGKMNTIPSVARADQTSENSSHNPLGAADVHSAADNATALGLDHGATGGVVSGTGDQLPASVESKRMNPK